MASCLCPFRAFISVYVCLFCPMQRKKQELSVSVTVQLAELLPVPCKTVRFGWLRRTVCGIMIAQSAIRHNEIVPPRCAGIIPEIHGLGRKCRLCGDAFCPALAVQCERCIRENTCLTAEQTEAEQAVRGHHIAVVSKKVVGWRLSGKR